MKRTFYIAVEGPIGVGKTTLARLLSEALHTELLLEVFEENPFLPRFYADRERYAFQTQIFFLLSRYRQQRDVIPRVLQHSPLVSDYLFAKDRIFAHLNLKGDELAVYEQLHRALAERIPAPDLVVYLKANTDVLLERIAFRDRPYERNMSREYLDALRQAYEAFFATYTEAPVLTIDTNHLNLVSDPDARAQVIGRVRAALEEGAVERPLPGVLPAQAPTTPEPAPAVVRRRLADLQAWLAESERERGLSADPIAAYLNLTQGTGALAAWVNAIWEAQERYRHETGNLAEAQERAVQDVKDHLQSLMADLLQALLRLANACDVDLESAFFARWTDREEVKA